MDGYLFDGCSDWLWLHGVDLAECKAQETISSTRRELRAEFAGKLNALILHAKTAQGHVICSDEARSRGA